ncbi:Fungal specific transcription factor domain containing protein [Rhypophila sp. PSN 637]
MPRPPRDTLPDRSHRDSIAPTSSSSGRGPDERLPVNPRRTKVAPDQRKRVAKACNRCNQKRIKCSGDRPCRQCANSSRECRYPPPVQKVTIAHSDLVEFQATRRRYNAQASRLKLLESLLQEKGIPLPPVERVQSPPPDMGDVGALSPTGYSPPGDVTMSDVMDGMSELAEVQEDKGKLLTDNDGTERFLGETSGANYMDACKSFIVISHHILCGNSSISSNSAFLASTGRYQTFDSRPLNLPPVDPLVLPPAAEIAAMLADISTYIQDGNGSFGSGGIFYWPWKDLASISPSPPGSKTGNRHLALYHVGFALASLLKGRPSEQHFARAVALLGNPLDVGLHSLSFDDVPALALMALYLVENNRRDHAYKYIRIAITISIEYGAHWDKHAVNSPAEESRRRTFWTVYILERWLSCLMGRPSSIAEEAVNLPVPEQVPGMPSPVGLLANIRLAKISHMIVDHSSLVEHSYRLGNMCGSRFAVKKQKRIVEDLDEWNEDIVDELLEWNKSLPPELTFNISKTLEPIHEKKKEHEANISKKRKEHEANMSKSPEPNHEKKEHEAGNMPEQHQVLRSEGPVNSLARLLGDSSSAPSLEQVHNLKVGRDLTQDLGDRSKQLFILAFRPAFLSAVKKLVAVSYLNHREGLHQQDQIEEHPLKYEFRASVEAARSNLMMGTHIKEHLKAPGNKLLVADLHHIFNAAVVLLMYRISFVNWRTNDTYHIDFARKVFEEEASSGSVYGKDCFAVLDELNRMVDGLRLIIHDKKWPPGWPLRTQQDEADSDYNQRLEQLISWRTEPWEKVEWESPATDDMQVDEDYDIGSDSFRD